MGNTQDKPVDDSSGTSSQKKEAIPPEQIIQKLDKFNTLTKTIDKVNKDVLVQFLGTITMDETDKKQIEALFLQIDDAFKKGTNDESILKLLSIDNSKRNNLQQFVQKEEFFQLNPNIGKNLMKSLDVFSSINAKYKFYLYKYIQLNAFIPDLIKTASDINNDLFNNMEVILLEQQTLTNSLLAQFIQILEELTYDVEDSKLLNLDNSIKLLENNVVSDMKNYYSSLQGRLEAIKGKSIEDMLKFVIDQQSEQIKTKIGINTNNKDS